MVTHHRVGVRQQVSEHVEEALIFDQLRVDVVQLRDTHSGRLAHVWILVLQTLAQRLAQVLSDLINTNTAHCSHGKSANEGVVILTILQNNRIRL